MKVDLTADQKAAIMRLEMGAQEPGDKAFLSAMTELLVIQHEHHAEDGDLYLESGSYELTIDIATLDLQVDKI